MTTKAVKLIDNWRSWWRFWSVQLGLLGTALTSVLIASPDAALYAWGILPSDLKSMIPPNLTPLIGVGVFVLSMLARVLKQRALPVNEAKPDDELKS